jgi:hypothetical protein
MKITITDKKKKDNFISLFSVLKNCSSLINVTFESKLLHIQGMDKSHICLFDVKINKNWFSTYETFLQSPALRGAAREIYFKNNTIV